MKKNYDGAILAKNDLEKERLAFETQNQSMEQGYLEKFKILQQDS